MKVQEARETIKNGKAVLDIEFGASRIKAMLGDENNTPSAPEPS